MIDKPDIIKNETIQITVNEEVDLKTWLLNNDYKIHPDWKSWRIGNTDTFENYGDYFIEFKDLYNDYKKNNQISKNKFGRDLSKICGVTNKTINKKTVIIRIGIYKELINSDDEL